MGKGSCSDEARPWKVDLMSYYPTKAEREALELIGWLRNRPVRDWEAEQAYRDAFRENVERRAMGLWRVWETDDYGELVAGPDGLPVWCGGRR